MNRRGSITQRDNYSAAESELHQVASVRNSDCFHGKLERMATDVQPFS